MSTEKPRSHSFAVRFMFWLPGRRRFSHDEYSELFRLLGSETRALRKRPTYVLGILVSFGLAGYLLCRGLAAGEWQLTVLGLLIAFGHVCGVNAVREHLCERLLRLKRHPEELASV